MHFPIDPNFPHKNEDNEYLDSLKDIPVNPVFIMGLHRSGTTFLYDSISRCFPVANLTLYDIFCYHRLLKNRREGREDAERQHLNRVFRSLGITDRRLDSVWVEDTTVEEYGWLLRNESYHISIHQTNKDYFAQICKKLLALNPNAQSVLMKSPWDTGNAKQILEWFPNARFIYITRDPIFILNSQINAFLTLVTGSQPFQTMLLDNFKVPGGTYSMQAFYGVWKVVRGIKAIFGDAVFSLFTRPFTALAVQEQLSDYYGDMKVLPKKSFMTLTYGAFNNNPEGKLTEIQTFLDLPFTSSPKDISPNPRKGHLKESLKKYESKLMKRLHKKLGHSAAVDNK